MKHIEDALLRMVKAGLETAEMQKNYLDVGLDDGPLFEIYGNILEGIYALIGEHTEEFSDSVTHLVMSVPYLTAERRAKMLMAEFRKNFPQADIPAPMFVTEQERRDLFRKNGGYMSPEGDWQ